ncbi:hypothetical protein FQZ97_603370 [compost metagenome]
MNSNAAKLGLKANLSTDGKLTIESSTGENVSFGLSTNNQVGVSVQVQDASGNFGPKTAVADTDGKTVVGYVQLNSPESYAISSATETVNQDFNQLALTTTKGTSGADDAVSFEVASITVAGAGYGGTAQTIDLSGIDLASVDELLAAIKQKDTTGALIVDDTAKTIRSANGNDITFGAITQKDSGGGTATTGLFTLNQSQLLEDGSSSAATAVTAAAITKQTASITGVPGGHELFGSASATKNSVSEVDISSADGAQRAIAVIDNALAGIDSQRADLGAVQNRFENTINNLQNISENASAARSRIKDTDYASETANLSKNQVLQQAGTAILAQAKQLPQAVLSLLQ